MANVVKLKRGTGSDPSASDMVVGEPVIRTDTAELFFKKDDGSVAKVSGGGGGPDFKYLALRNAANNGSASYPGNDFTLVTSGTTNAVTPAAANTLLVSYGGVIQQPNSGTSTSGITGFIVDGSRIKTATNFAAAPDFILYQEAGGIGEPSDNTVSEAKLNVSNSPTNGYFLSAQSGNTGGLTWAEVSGGVTSDSQYNTLAGTGPGNAFDGTNPEYNSLFGYRAGYSITTGDGNTSLGYEALLTGTTANWNVTIGYQAMKNTTTSVFNTAVGVQAMKSNTTGQENVAIGYDALENGTEADYSIAIGSKSLHSCTTGDYNIAIGYQALDAVTTTGQNIAIGSNALGAAIGAFNVGVGQDAGSTLADANNSILIGRNAQPSSTTASNEITLGNTSITKFRIPGLNFSIKDSTATDNYVLTVDANGDAGWEAAAAGVTINNNADNRVITGSGTANTLEGESTFTFDGTKTTTPVVSASNGIVETAATIATNHTITSNYNAMSAGPITVSATVTVPSGSVWTVI